LVNIVVVFYRSEEARTLRDLFVKAGFNVAGVFTSGAQTLALADELQEGIVVCGYKFPDMMYNELKEKLPEHFEMLLVAGRSRWDDDYGDDIMRVEMPLKIKDLLDTLNMMVSSIERRRRKRRNTPKVRNEKEMLLIGKAKELLMDRNDMTEEEAHRYIQKTSMDTGTNLIETAQMILEIM